MAVKPKLALIPSGVKASKLYSVLPSDASGDFDFSRSGSATRINKDGLIETVDADIPRLNYPLIDGVVSGCPSLLLENSATNLLQYSEDFTQSEWSRTRVALPVLDTISPYGSLSAYTVVNNDTGTCIMFDNEIGSSTNDSTFSVFVKYKDLQYISLRIDTPTDAALFDIINGVIIDSDANITPKIENYGNGWFRCSITHDSLTSSDNAVIRWNETGDLNDNTMTSTNVGYYLFGAQYEVGSFPTSYIPSLTGSQTTRSAETCNNSGNANTFNDSEGVLMAEISGFNETVSVNNWITISDETSNNYIAIQQETTGYVIARVKSSGVTQALMSALINQEIISKIAIKYKENDFALWINGFELSTDTSGSVFSADTLTKLHLNYIDVSNDFYGNTKQIQYFDTALTDTDLEELTSWTSFNEMATGQLYTIE